MIRISWRQVFDCKTPGEDRSKTAKMAYTRNYLLFVHNGTVYVTGDGDSYYELRGAIIEEEK